MAAPPPRTPGGDRAASPHGAGSRTARLRYRGELHRLPSIARPGYPPLVGGARRSAIDGPASSSSGPRRRTGDRWRRVLEAWFRARGRGPTSRRDRPARGRVGVEPDRRVAARPAVALGECLARGPAVVLVAAGPRPAGGPRDGRDPRARPSARVRSRPAASGRSSRPPAGSRRCGAAGCATTRSSCTARSTASSGGPVRASKASRRGRSSPAGRRRARPPRLDERLPDGPQARRRRLGQRSPGRCGPA